MNDDRTVVPMPEAPDGVELRHLRAFVAVADELNFSRAADRLFLSQPALSRQIRMLERLIGCDLFRRTTQRVELTLAGEAFLAKARPLLADVADAIAAARAVGGELSGRMARAYQPWVTAARDIENLEDIRQAAEDLHRPYAPPPDVRAAPVVAGGTPALRLTPPDATDSVILYLHGGGHVAGSAFGYQHLVGAVANAARSAAVVIDYRLAPEHPFPASLEDALGAYRWLLDSGSAVTVVGDSSGGGLVMSLLLTLRDQGIPLPAGAALLCPWVDLSGRAQRPPREAPILFVPEMAKVFASAYLAGQDDPVVNPLTADLTGLPPLLVQAASGDSVLPEAQLLTERAREHGVATRTTIYPVPTHDFHVFWTFLPEAAAAVAEVGRFVQDVTTAATRRTAT